MATAGERQITVRDPRSGEVDFHLQPATSEEVSAVAERLRQAQTAWGEAPVEHRVAVMQRWAQAVERHRDAITQADARDTGYGQISFVAVDMMLGLLRANAMTAAHAFKAAERQGRSAPMPHIAYESVLKPIPLVGVISPWNAPTMLSMLHAIPPLFAGCAVLLKPSEVTPRFAGPLMEAVREIPELAAVFDIVLGDGETGAAVVEACDLISFTGSVANGRRVAEACARRLIPCELELGGKDPVVVAETANLDDAASAIIRGAVTSTGQVCFSIERVYVQAAAHDALVERLIDKAERIQLNFPDPMSGQIGPFISARQAEIVDAQIDDAVAKGAVIRCGGKSFNLGGGLYMRPTVLTGVTHEMAIMKDETFGPVIPVMSYGTEDEAVALANDSDFGLSAAVLAGTEDDARRIGGRINAGNVSVQDTFLTFAAGQAEADAFGASGLPGKRSGIQRYLRRQALLINTAKPACLLDTPLQAAK